MRLTCIVPPFWIATGTLTANSTTVTNLSSPYTPFVGQPIANSTALAAGTTISTVNSSSQLTLSSPAIASGSINLYLGLEPITLAEAKQHARVEYDDDDSLIYDLIGAARRVCETKLRSALFTQTWVLYLDSFPNAGGYYNRAIREVWPSMSSMPATLGVMPGLVPNSTGVISLPLPPLQSIVSLEYQDFEGNTQTVSPSIYNISLGTPSRLQPKYSQIWPVAAPIIDAVQITFVCGQSLNQNLITPSVKSAMKLMVGHWYENRDWVSADGMYATVPNTVDVLLACDDPGIYAG